MGDSSIELRSVSLLRRTQEEFHYDFKRWFFSLLKGRARPVSRRRVLTDVDFQLASGAKIGIIGANGSGKSTLLKVICGILTPTKGTVRVEGTISPLIELGAGFDPDLSVADNIVYYGILLGHDRQTMLERTPAILEFAELSDRQHEPVKALSSGMAARLGFAVATELRPDILILDEVLSVGDEAFRQKCRWRLQGLWDKAITVIVVSHDMSFIVENCETAIRMDGGRIVDSGPAGKVVNAYLADVHDTTHEPVPLTAYNRFIEFLPSQLAGMRPCEARIDRMSVDGERIDLLGWAIFDSVFGIGNDAYLLIGERHLARLPFQQARPDIANARNDERLRHTGFSGTIDLPALPDGTYSMRVIVRRGAAFGVSDELGPLVVKRQDGPLAFLA